MEALIRNLSIIAYYLSEFDMNAVNALGYANRSIAFKEISIAMGKPNNYLKRRSLWTNCQEAETVGQFRWKSRT